VVVTGNPFLVVLAPLPASGTLDLPINFGDVIPNGSASTIFLQGAMLSPTGGALLADPVAFTQWDE
jgi:hypothetical protein